MDIIGREHLYTADLTSVRLETTMKVSEGSSTLGLHDGVRVCFFLLFRLGLIELVRLEHLEVALH